MEKLIVIASLGRVRPLKFQKTGDDPLQPSHLVEEPNRMVEMKREHVGALVTDQAGRFGQSAPPGRKAGMSYGEGHNLETELESQTLHRVADTIAEIVAQEGHPAWCLVAPQEIMRSLEQALPAAVRDCLARTETGDLTKLPLMELEKRLQKKH